MSGRPLIPGETMVRIPESHVLIDRWRRDGEPTGRPGDPADCKDGLVLDLWGPTESDPYPWAYVMFAPYHKVRHYLFRPEELVPIS